MNLFYKNKSNGFSLVEILVVFTIIGILATVFYLSFSDIRKTARDAQRLSDIKQLSLAFKAYHQRHSVFPSTTPVPATFSSADLFLVCLGVPSSATCPNAVEPGRDAVNDALLELYSTIPQDPDYGKSCGGFAYKYSSWDNGRKAALHWYYENDDPSPPNACGDGTYGGVDSCGSYCKLILH